MITGSDLDHDDSSAGEGPLIVAPALWSRTEDGGSWLTPEERGILASVATVVRLQKGETIYKQGQQANALFNIAKGVAKSHIRQSEKKTKITGFQFPNDIVGIAQNGKYMNSAEAVTSIILYRIYGRSLEKILEGSPGITIKLIRKLWLDLHANHCYTIVLKKRHAVSKVAWFIQDIGRLQRSSANNIDEIYLAMNRLDIADYLGISPEAVSRSFRSLIDRGAIHLRDRRHVQIVNEADLEAVASEFVIKL